MTDNETGSSSSPTQKRTRRVKRSRKTRKVSNDDKFVETQSMESQSTESQSTETESLPTSSPTITDDVDILTLTISDPVTNDTDNSDDTDGTDKESASDAGDTSDILGTDEEADTDADTVSEMSEGDASEVILSEYEMIRMCKCLGLDLEDVRNYIDDCEGDYVNDKLSSLFDDTDGEVDPNNDEYAMLCSLSLMKRMVALKTRAHNYRRRSDLRDQRQKLYDRSNTLAKRCDSLISATNGSGPCPAEISDEITNVVNAIMTERSKKIEMIKYKLLYYTPPTKVQLRAERLERSCEAIKAELDTASDLFGPYLEDDKWKINTDRTVNFKVPKSKVVFSNTINLDDVGNDYLDTYLQMMISYLRRFTDSKSIKLHTRSDNKYSVHWVLIIMSVRP